MSRLRIRSALLEEFGFERRELGQDVALSEVTSVIQQVPGVAYVDVDVLGGIPEKRRPRRPDVASLTPREIADILFW